MHTLTATSAQKCLLAVDASGVPVTTGLAGLSDRDAAAAARDAIDALLCVRVSVVAAVSTADLGAVVTLREVTDNGVAYRTAAATGASSGEAVGRAVLDAFDVSGSIIEPAAERWAGDADVRAVTVMRGEAVQSVGAHEEHATHRRLLETMPGAGILSVDVSGAGYRIVRLPGVAIGCTLVPSARVVTRFDDWARALQGRVR